MSVVCVCIVCIVCIVSQIWHSNMCQSVIIDMDTPTATDPRLNLTARVQNIQHLLDGKSDITPDESIQSPLHQEDTISSSGNGEDRVVTNLRNGEPTRNDGTKVHTDDGSGNAIQVRNVLTAFFNLSPDDQGTAVLQYKNSIDKLLEQNQKMTELVTSVNLEREWMGSQITAVMAENQWLLEALKDQPSAEEVTSRIQERCREDYNRNLTELVRLNQQEILDQKEKTPKRSGRMRQILWQSPDHFFKWHKGKIQTKTTKRIKKQFGKICLGTKNSAGSNSLTEWSTV